MSGRQRLPNKAGDFQDEMSLTRADRNFTTEGPLAFMQGNLTVCLSDCLCISLCVPVVFSKPYFFLRLW